MSHQEAALTIKSAIVNGVVQDASDDHAFIDEHAQELKRRYPDAVVETQILATYPRVGVKLPPSTEN